jgi:hypothetical protein
MKFLLIFLGILPFAVKSQSFVNRTYSQQYDIQAKSVVQMGNGSYLVVGTQSFSNGFLSVHDENGQCIQTAYLSLGALSSYQVVRSTGLKSKSLCKNTMPYRR